MVHPIILCGGTGIRLWPSSRETFPKQFAPIMGDRSPYQNMLELFSGSGFDAPVVATQKDFRFLAEDQAGEVGVWDARINLEPDCRGTAASVLCAALTVEDDPDALILVSPIVHYAGDAEAFQTAIHNAEARVRKGAVIRFLDGITQPQISSAKILEEMVAEPRSGGVSALPEREDDEDPHGQALGMTLMRRADLLAAFEDRAPKMLKICRKAVEQGKTEANTLTYGAVDFAEIPNHSFEGDILKSVKGALQMPLGGPCTGLEDWSSVWSVMDQDQNGVSAHGGALAVDCRDSMLRCEESAMQVLGIGLTNVVAVAMRDAVLVADRDHLAKIPGALEKLEARKTPHAREYPRYHRPWGWYESLIARDRFQVKRIMVKPGGVLSLQSHVHRSEHWIVVGGTAKVTVDDEVKLVPENGSVYIPLGATHRMANPGKVPMYLIEVQTGTYLGEDDIERYEDIYDRC